MRHGVKKRTVGYKPMPPELIAVLEQAKTDSIHEMFNKMLLQHEKDKKFLADLKAYVESVAKADGIQETGAAIQHIKELIADYERTPIAWG